MKTIFFLSALLCMSLGSFNSYSQQAQLPPLVSVTGVGEVKVKPDQLVFSVGVDVRGKTLEETQKAADQRTAAIIKALKKSGVEDKHIQTAHISIHPNYAGEFAQTTPQFYMANRIISVTLTKIDRYDEVMANLYQAGANRVDGINYQSSQLAKYQEEARRKAIQNAQQKAKTLANEAGAKVGKVYNITESGANSPGPVMFKAARESMVMDAGGTTVAAGEIVVTSSVEVSFILE